MEKIFRTHFVLEPFLVACCRCLSSRHPVLKMILPHLRYVSAGNLVIRTSLLNSGGILDKLISFGRSANSIIYSRNCIYLFVCLLQSPFWWYLPGCLTETPQKALRMLISHLFVGAELSRVKTIVRTGTAQGSN